MILTGRIVKGIGGFYYVNSDGKEYTLKAPGKFRKDGIKPVVGDIVEFLENDGCIKEILPRHNEFYRPPVSNVSQAFIVMTGAYPKVDLYLIDKLIIQCELADINIILIINKCDIMTENEIENLKEQYSKYEIICCSTIENKGIDEIKNRIKNNISFFSGQSGVGKSTIINSVCGDFWQKTGDISEKLKRGKHTTRHVELVYLPELEGSILDTPGFSYYDFREDFNTEACYREFGEFRNFCRFNGCTHINEPGCAVKEQVGKSINKNRYDRYVQICKIQNEARSKQYD